MIQGRKDYNHDNEITLYKLEAVFQFSRKDWSEKGSLTVEATSLCVNQNILLGRFQIKLFRNFGQSKIILGMFWVKYK